jgi:oligosaccharyltransferase complex subunit beta
LVFRRSRVRSVPPFLFRFFASIKGTFFSSGPAFQEEHDRALLNNSAIRETRSIYFKSLIDVAFRLTDDSSIVLKKYGEYLFGHIVLFAPSVEEFGGSLSVEGITEFIDHDGNLLVTDSSHIGDILHAISTERGFETDDDGTAVIDHLNFDVNRDEGRRTLIAADPENLVKSPTIASKSNVNPILYRGTGLIVDRENPRCWRS